MDTAAINQPAGALRRAREQRQAGLRATARGAGVDPSWLSKVERRERPLTVALLARLADVLDLSADDIAVIVLEAKQ